MVNAKERAKKYKVNQPFSMHVEIDFEGTTESDGEIYTVTPDIIFDQLSYVFEKLKHKDIKVRFKMAMSPRVQLNARKKQG